MHFNDNYGRWDDDMVVGSVHLMPFVEAVYWLKRVGYAGWRSLDLFPYREDPDIAVLQSIRFIQRVDALIDEMGIGALTDLIRQQRRSDRDPRGQPPPPGRGVTVSDHA